jgi:hypothetical protein
MDRRQVFGAISGKLVFRNCLVSLYATPIRGQTKSSDHWSPVMRLFKLLVMFAICLGVVGFWQGWFSVSRTTSPDANTDKTNLNVSIDREKMRSDIKKVKETVKEKVQERAKERAKNAEAREKAATEKK